LEIRALVRTLHSVHNSKRKTLTSIGKTTVARHYARVLSSLQVLPGDGFIETTGSKLAHGGISEVKGHLQQLSEGGVFFLDEAYQLAEGNAYGGKTVLDFLLAEIENLTGTVVFVFAGYRRNMEKFFEHNPGFSSRIPYVLHFEDYTDAELLSMLQYKMDQYFKKTGITIEDGPDGLFMNIVRMKSSHTISILISQQSIAISV
jgi:hypothetical protein